MDHQQQELSLFKKKIWIAGGIISFLVILFLLIKATFSVFLLLLAGSLIAIFFRGLSDVIQRKTNWGYGISLTTSVLSTLIFIVGLFWLIGAEVQTQVIKLSDTLPSTFETLKENVKNNPIGNNILEKATSPESQKKAKEMASTFFKSTFGVLGDVYVILFIGLFLTVSPKIYTKGILAIIPPKGKDKADELLEKLDNNLFKWLQGKLFAMMVVFILTAIGLFLMGVPMWLALALIAGLLSFVPNFGPIIAIIPAVLVALMQGQTTALLVVGLYIAVQVVESNFITPFIQQKLINIPPALIITAQLLMGTLTGGWGLVLATPLMLIVITLVKELYVKKIEQQTS